MDKPTAVIENPVFREDYNGTLRAYGKVLAHPKLDTRGIGIDVEIITSRVMSVDFGSMTFETRNTRYKVVITP